MDRNVGSYDLSKPLLHHVKLRTLTVAAALTVFTSSQGILTTLSQTDGKYLYDYATVPLLAEMLKLAFSMIMLWREERMNGTRSTLDWRTARLYPIPSLIYLIHNNVQFATLTYVDTSTYQIMGNLKIVTTGILFRLFLRRKLSNLQWMAIILLTVGTTTSQIKGCGEGNCGSLFSAPYEGYFLGLVSAFLSALAGVYTEFLMKKTNESLYWQNAQLYLFGVLFNFLRLVLEGGWQKVWGLFNGYDVMTWLVVLNLGCTGLLVSWIMKYADNIVKLETDSHSYIKPYFFCRHLKSLGSFTLIRCFGFIVEFWISHEGCHSHISYFFHAS